MARVTEAARGACVASRARWRWPRVRSRPRARWRTVYRHVAAGCGTGLTPATACASAPAPPPRRRSRLPPHHGHIRRRRFQPSTTAVTIVLSRPSQERLRRRSPAAVRPHDHLRAHGPAGWRRPGRHLAAGGRSKDPEAYARPPAANPRVLGQGADSEIQVVSSAARLAGGDRELPRRPGRRHRDAVGRWPATPPDCSRSTGESWSNGARTAGGTASSDAASTGMLYWPPPWGWSTASAESPLITRQIPIDRARGKG